MSTLAVNALQAQTGTNISMTSGHTMQANLHSSTVFPAGVVIQVTPVNYDSTNYSTTTNSYIDLANPNVTMTPKFASSRIHVVYQVNSYHVSGHGIGIRLKQDSTVVYGSGHPSYETYHGSTDAYERISHTVDLAAGSTSQRTYSLQWSKYATGTAAQLNVGGLQSWMYVMEIAQ